MLSLYRRLVIQSGTDAGRVVTVRELRVEDVRQLLFEGLPEVEPGAPDYEQLPALADAVPDLVNWGDVVPDAPLLAAVWDAVLALNARALGRVQPAAGAAPVPIERTAAALDETIASLIERGHTYAPNYGWRFFCETLERKNPQT